MNFLTKMSISQKLFLIPIIGTVGFLLYLAITTSTALTNVALLDDVIEVQYPALDVTKTALVKIEKVRDTLSSAAITGDEDALDNARTIAAETEALLKEIKSINPALASEANNILSAFDSYYKYAYDVSESMVNQTADMSKLGQMSGRMNSSYEELTKALTVFRDARIKAFQNAIQDSKESGTALIKVGAIMAISIIILLFATAIPIVTGLKGSIVQVVTSLKDIAQEDGDLTVRLNTKNKDEIGDLVYWFNQFMEKLQGVVKDIVNASLPLSQLAQNLNQLTDDTNKTIDVQQRAAFVLTIL